jgi:hypothetical protein
VEPKSDKGGNYSNDTVFAFKEHFVATGAYFTHLPLFLYILSLNSSKGGAWKIRQSLSLQTVLNKDAKPNPRRIDIIIFPLSVCKNLPK